MVAGISIIIVFTILPLILTGAFKRVPNQKKVKGILQSAEFSNYDKDSSFDDMFHNLYYYFKYVVDGKEYLIKSKYKVSNIKVNNQKRTIKYNSKNPEQAIICPDYKIYIFTFICFVIGIFVIGYSTLNDSNDYCCTCLDCPMCDVCCDCDNPYLNK